MLVRSGSLVGEFEDEGEHHHCEQHYYHQIQSAFDAEVPTVHLLGLGIRTLDLPAYFVALAEYMSTMSIWPLIFYFWSPS